MMARPTRTWWLFLLAATACWKENPLFEPESGSPANTGSVSTSTTSSDTSTADPSSGTTTTSTGSSSSGTTGVPDPVCGDGIEEFPPELCDNGPNNGPGQPCESNCRPLFLLGNKPTFQPTDGLKLVAGDFDGDMVDDIAVADTTTTVKIWRNTNKGSVFDPMMVPSLDVGSTAVKLLAYDWTGDKKAELAVGREGGVFVYSVGGGNPLGELMGDPLSIALGDKDNNAILDLLIVQPDPPAVQWLLGSGNEMDGGFLGNEMITTTTGSRRLTVANVNPDTKPDLLVSVAAAPNFGFSIFPSFITPAKSYNSNILEGADEIIVARVRENAMAPMKDSVGVFDASKSLFRFFDLDNMDFTLQVSAGLSRPIKVGLHGPDLDDFVLLNPTEGKIHIYSFPDGLITETPLVIDFMGTLYDLTVGDFNADGSPDLAVLSGNGCYVLLNQLG